MVASGPKKPLKRLNGGQTQWSRIQPTTPSQPLSPYRMLVGPRLPTITRPGNGIKYRKRRTLALKPKPTGPPPSVKLEKGRIYKFQCSAVGNFRIKGGDTGDVTIGGFKVTISDDRGKTVFAQGGPNDTIKIKDNTKDKTTAVSLVRGTTKTKCIEGSKTVTVNGITIKGKTSVTLMDGNGIKVSSLAKTQGKPKQNSPMKIVARPGESIVVSGSLDYVVTGNGGHIKITGSGSLVVEGSPQSVSLAESGSVEVNGKVRGDVSSKGSGDMIINGDVDGGVSLTGSGDINVYGDVGSAVRSSGSGDILIDGTAWSSISVLGSGDVTVRGGDQ